MLKLNKYHKIIKLGRTDNTSNTYMEKNHIL